MKVTREPNPDPKTQPLYYWCALMERYMPVRDEMKPRPDFPMYRIEPPDEANAAYKKFKELAIGDVFQLDGTDKTRYIKQSEVSAYFFTDDGREKMLSVGQNNPFVTTLDVEFCDLKVGEWFKWTDVYTKKLVQKTSETEYVYYGDKDTYDITKAVMKNHPVLRAAPPLTFADIAIGDPFHWANGTTRCIKTGTITWKDSEGRGFSCNNNKDCEVKKLPLTFADLKIGDWFRWVKDITIRDLEKISETEYRDSPTCIRCVKEERTEHKEVIRLETEIVPADPWSLSEGQYALDLNGEPHLIKKIKCTVRKESGWEFDPFKRVPRKK